MYFVNNRQRFAEHPVLPEVFLKEFAFKKLMPEQLQSLLNN
jgi:hypothetical protein